MRVEDWTQLHDVVVTSSVGLFSSVGLNAVYGGSAPRLDDALLVETLAIIGLGGPLRGCLVLSVPTSILRRSHPGGATNAVDVTDWLTELANLLLGRIKHRLLGRGVSTELSTPLTVSGTALQLVRFPGMPVAHAFHVGSETIHVVFGAVAPEELHLVPNPDEPIVRLGEVVLF